MKGLLIKDFRLMKNMANSVAIILLVALGMCFYISDMNFIIAYLTVVGTTFTSSTISYDEFDNGNAFLFALPVSRKDYVLEKYLFALLVSGGGWLVGSVLTVTVGALRKGLDPKESIMTALMMLPVAICLSVFLLPLRLKFEGEKSRIAIFIATGGFFVVVVTGVKVAEKLGIDLNALVQRMPVMSAGMGVLAALGVSIALLLLSCQISIRIMEHKEF